MSSIHSKEYKEVHAATKAALMPRMLWNPKEMISENANKGTYSLAACGPIGQVRMTGSMKRRMKRETTV